MKEKKKLKKLSDPKVQTFPGFYKIYMLWLLQGKIITLVEKL